MALASVADAGAPVQEHWLPASIRIIVAAVAKMDEERVALCVASISFLICVLTVAIHFPDRLTTIIENSGAVWAAALGLPAFVMARKWGGVLPKNL